MLNARGRVFKITEDVGGAFVARLNSGGAPVQVEGVAHVTAFDGFVWMEAANREILAMFASTDIRFVTFATPEAATAAEPGDVDMVAFLAEEDLDTALHEVRAAADRVAAAAAADAL